MHDVLDRQLDERHAMHEREGHGVECDVDPAGVGRHRVGVRGDGLLFERVDLGHAGSIADVVRDLLEPGPRPSGQVDAGALVRKRARHRAADRAAGAVDHRGLVLQHRHHDSFDHRGEHVVRGCRHHRVEKVGAPSPPSSRVRRCPYTCGHTEPEASRESGAVTTDLMTRARADDGDAFRVPTDPHRRELQMHCYRMLGSLQNAEDAVQDTPLAAWQGLGGFEDRASIRTWLYRIATNRCLNALRSTSRRVAKEWNIPEVEPPEPTGPGEGLWPGAVSRHPPRRCPRRAIGPEARYEQTEANSLAFVIDLQVLPARQRAVIILR